ncbi:unnamed protein product, partial [Lepidochelys olivacea]
QAIEDLMKQSYSASACVDVSCSVPDLAPALRDIQIESEGIAAKNLQEIDEWYKTRFLDFNQPSTKHAENLRRFREEIGNCKRMRIEELVTSLSGLHLIGRMTGPGQGSTIENIVEGQAEPVDIVPSKPVLI